MSTSPRYLPRYTVSDYHRWEGDWELWDGVAISMTPSPFGRHQQLALQLASTLLWQIKAQRCSAVVLSEIDWIISDHTVVRPDVIVLCGDVPQQHVLTTPVIIAEVLSPSTAQRDQTTKLELYRERQVPYYLILDPVTNRMRAWALDRDGHYQPMEDQPCDLSVCDDCELRLTEADLF